MSSFDQKAIYEFYLQNNLGRASQAGNNHGKSGNNKKCHCQFCGPSNSRAHARARRAGGDSGAGSSDGNGSGGGGKGSGDPDKNKDGSKKDKGSGGGSGGGGGGPPHNNADGANVCPNWALDALCIFIVVTLISGLIGLFACLDSDNMKECIIKSIRSTRPRTSTGMTPNLLKHLNTTSCGGSHNYKGKGLTMKTLADIPDSVQSVSEHLKKNKVPKFVAHRGDHFTFPEHTIPAYDIAMLENIDYVEPDLVMTKDGVLVCHHDLTLRDTTDIDEKPEFRHLITPNITLFLDGKDRTILNDWLIVNFTLGQLKTLKVKQAFSGVRPQYFNGIWGIPTFQEFIEVVHHDTWRRIVRGDDFVVGINPELKHPRFHNEIFHKIGEHYMEAVFMNELDKAGYLARKCKFNETKISCSPLVVQCYEVDTITYLSKTTTLRLLTLLDTINLRYLTYDGLAELKGKTKYIGIWKELLFTGTEAELLHEGRNYDEEEIDSLGGFIPPDEFVRYANGLGMKVGIFTIYHSSEDSLRGCAVQCRNDTKEEELEYYFEMGVEFFYVEGICESLRIRDRYFTRLDAGGGDWLRGSVYVVLAFVVLIWLS